LEVNGGVGEEEKKRLGLETIMEGGKVEAISGRRKFERRKTNTI
jgi:hypothetical protein